MPHGNFARCNSVITLRVRFFPPWRVLLPGTENRIIPTLVRTPPGDPGLYTSGKVLNHPDWPHFSNLLSHLPKKTPGSTSNRRPCPPTPPRLSGNFRNLNMVRVSTLDSPVRFRAAGSASQQYNFFFPPFLVELNCYLSFPGFPLKMNL